MAAPRAAAVAVVLPPIWVNMKTATELTGVGDDTLVAAVQTGKLRAKRTGENGGGLYLFKPTWLEAWGDGLVDA